MRGDPGTPAVVEAPDRIRPLASHGRRTCTGGSSYVAHGYGRSRPRHAPGVVAGWTPLPVLPIHASSPSDQFRAPSELHDLTARSEVNRPTDPEPRSGI
jgi:hypothetical protein